MSIRFEALEDLLREAWDEGADDRGPSFDNWMAARGSEALRAACPTGGRFPDRGTSTAVSDSIHLLAVERGWLPPEDDADRVRVLNDVRAALNALSPAEPVQEGRTLKVTEAIRTGGLSLRKQEGEPVPATDPVSEYEEPDAEARYWHRRYDENHRSLHSCEDALAKARAALAAEQDCSAPHCWSEYGTPCGRCQLAEQEPVERGLSVDAILRCLDRAYHPQLGENRDHPLDVLTNAGVVSSERVSAALSAARTEGGESQ